MVASSEGELSVSGQSDYAGSGIFRAIYTSL